jgi:hypothetical protein
MPAQLQIVLNVELTLDTSVTCCPQKRNMQLQAQTNKMERQLEVRTLFLTSEPIAHLAIQALRGPQNNHSL